MKYDIAIEQLSEKEFLVIRGYVTWCQLTSDNISQWEQRFGSPNKDLIDQLKIMSGSNDVYYLFCNTCVQDDVFDWVCSDDIACENINKIIADENFDIVYLAPSEYCKITYYYGGEMTPEQAAKEADDYFWEDWLKNNPYKSKIEDDLMNAPETADITFYDSKNNCTITWHPVERV